jgi:hypothetical protein
MWAHLRLQYRPFARSAQARRVTDHAAEVDAPAMTAFRILPPPSAIRIRAVYFSPLGTLRRDSRRACFRHCERTPAKQLATRTLWRPIRRHYFRIARHPPGIQQLFGTNSQNETFSVHSGCALENAQERNQVRFLLRRENKAKAALVKLHRVQQSLSGSVMEIRGPS